MAQCAAHCTEFTQCAIDCGSPQTTDSTYKLIGIFVLVFMVACSGMFSGLTLGLLSLSLEGLDLVKNSGTADEKKWAARIYPIRQRGNLLLCTLLFGNTMVNAVIAILSAEVIGEGLTGGMIASAAIVIFGEIIPQAICSRHGLRIGSSSMVIVRPLIYLFSPISWPISKVLDRVLGEEMREMYNKRHLDKLLEIHAGDQTISKDDQYLLSSALRFSEKCVHEIMTPLKDVFHISVTDVLDFERLKDIYQSGYTRIPVYHHRTDCIVGVLFAKDLILVDPNDEIPVASILPFCNRPIHAAPRHTDLDKMLQEMQSSRSHLFFVTEQWGSTPSRGLPRVINVAGIVTMEDLIEELISREIIDDFDIVTDNKSKKKVVGDRNSLPHRRLEFFNMLQRREELSLDMAGLSRELTAKTNDEVRALVSFFSSGTFQLFKPPAMTHAALKKLVQRSSMITITEEEVSNGRYVYVRGVPAAFMCVLLHGRLEIRAGNEGFTSEIGPWSPLALNALHNTDYVPDFTARVEAPSAILIIKRTQLQTARDPAFKPAAAGSSRLLGKTGKSASTNNLLAVEHGIQNRPSPSPGMGPVLMPMEADISPLQPLAILEGGDADGIFRL